MWSGESVRRVGVLIRHNLLLMRGEPGPLVSRMILPLAFLALLRPLYAAAQGEAAGTEQAVVGTLVTFSLLALGISGSAILTERLGRTWDRLRGTALRPAEILVGKAVPVFAAMLAQQLLVIGFGVWVLGLRVPHPPLLLGVLLCWSCTLLALGALLGVLVRGMGELSAAYDIGGMLLSSLGGALVPLGALPHWVAAVAPVSPGYWAVHGLCAALVGDAATVAEVCGVLLVVALACGALAVGRLKGRSGRLVAL
ncbi:ABC transporter permease [Microbispora sp. SCL1-1]|uniref:ABC transporter permease n=1 Tax=unclassified Microbispora TaxID=2614687 RepID=UPI00115B752C|nr:MULTISPECIES: ABC transporter permease [unclassified Microbispora]NJP28338.1 ABC transporter permease [Microbispora sp. CL1-1]TQS09168.1 ABC transporter permease [Microbispora sp. SCL1-1]